MSSAYVVQNRPAPDGGRLVYAWNMDEPEAYCDSGDGDAVPADRVIVVGTDRCVSHAGAEAPCPVAYRVPSECPHAVLTDVDGGFVRCATCGHVSVPVPLNVARFVTQGPATPTGPDESLDVVMLGDPDADHSSLLIPERS